MSLTIEEVARLLSAEAEQCVALLGGRTVGGGLRVAAVRLAVGQTGEVAEDEPFLLSAATEGRPGWAVEVRLDVPAGLPPPPPVVAPSPDAVVRTPVAVLGDEPCTVLRGTSVDTAALLRGRGVRDVGALAALPEARLDDLVIPEAGMRLLDAWSRAQLLSLPLPTAPLGDLGARLLSEVVGASPARLRDLGLPDTVADPAAERLSRGLALLGAALDLDVLRRLRIADVAPDSGGVS